MSVSENDVKVLGRVVSIAVDGIVADAELVYDTTVAKSLAEINAIILGSIEDLGSNVYLTIMQLDGKIAGCQSSILTTNSKIQAIEHDVAGKQDVLTFDNVPTANSNNPVKSGGIKTAIDDAVNGLKTNFTTEDIKIVYNDQQYANIYGNDDALRFVVSAPDFFISSTSGTTISSNGAISIVSHGEDGVSLDADNGGATISSSATTSVIGNEEVGISSDSAININAGEEINLNAPSVKVNGTNIDTIKNNAQNALNKINAMHPGQDTGMRVETPGIYYAYCELGNPELIPSSMVHGIFDAYLLLVTHVSEIDIHGGYRHLHQLIIDIVTGRKAARVINYPYDSTIDWSTAPNFTEV